MTRLILLFAIIAGVFSAGIRQPRISSQTSRIINGVDATLGDVPHQLSMKNWLGGHRCGASVIADNWAVTAAHCKPLTTFGLTVSGTFNDGSPFEVSVLEWKQHPSYEQGEGSFPNDIAVLRLATSYNLTELKVRLADFEDGDFANELCIISGWGITEDGSSPDETTVNSLKLANVTVYSTDECRDLWGASSIVEDHICVQGRDGDGTGACNGDSGGPLTCRDANQQWVLAGVTSWGISGCHVEGTVTHPSVYARVSSFKSWINQACGNCLV